MAEFNSRAHSEPISKGQLLWVSKSMGTPALVEEAVSRIKRKAIIKRLEGKTLETLDIHNRVFVNLHVGVVSSDNTTAWRHITKRSK